MEFEFFLAEQLGWSRGQVRQLPNAEFVLWTRYFARKAQRQQLEELRAGG